MVKSVCQFFHDCASVMSNYSFKRQYCQQYLRSAKNLELNQSLLQYNTL